MPRRLTFVRSCLFLLCASALMSFKTTSVQAAPPFKMGERIVFLGDSITQAGVGPSGYVTLVKKAIAEKYADLNVEVIGAGIGGNKVPDLENRLERDVLSKKPTIVVIYIGINDVWHSTSGKGTSKEAFEKGLRNIIAQIQEVGAKVILCTASVIGEKKEGGNDLDKMLDEYCDISRTVAKETKSQLLDLRAAFASFLKENNREDVAKNILTTDGVHLNAAGNVFVADQMLVALGAKETKVLRHVVLFKFKAETTPEQVKEIEQAFAALPLKIDSIIDFEYGTDVSVENLSQGFTHCFLVTFRDKAGREVYLPHPAHKEFVELALPKVEKAMVVDYMATR